MSKVIVVGGGAAGMMAAISAAECGHSVTLLEQNEKLGKKIYITGKGRCNLTNASDLENVFSNIVTNPKFLYSAIYGFDNQSSMDFFEQNGLKIKIERGNRFGRAWMCPPICSPNGRRRTNLYAKNQLRG